ncbi:hypothetical protein FAZ69_08410 [Trinickia terrae]|uniref:FtsK domain-containing protein n=1 Tax=Trinickia terrae TaxID=2571161 RepID=A0A4U1I9H6_9BURK|nr:FtsK/SpoIIIE domain-containing protein [Trinickia terrae]TKC90161.1 hypothetical protein FAZ69_08410 [Trinickia terrae]
MAVERKYRGIEQRDEVRPGQARPDTRSRLTRARAFFATTDGVIAAMLFTPVIALVCIRVPFSGEMILLTTWMFYQFFVNPGHNDPKRTNKAGQVIGKFRLYDFPFRIPAAAKRFDGSYAQARLGNGITFLGREISTKLEIWSSDSDLRTHMLVLGTTGSGKTEFLLGLVYNALVQNSGFLYTDGKGAVDLYHNVFRLARYLGREDDLLVISFLTSGRDFLDKQVDRTTNTMNPFALGSSGMLIELIISLMDDSGGGGDMWKGRAIAFVAGLTRVLCYLRDRGYLLLDANTFIGYFELPVVERVVFQRTITIGGENVVINDPLFERVIEPLKSFVLTLPGYSRDKLGQQEQKTMEQHGFITMQLTRLFGDLSFTYGYIFQTLLGEVDMYDVVINRRILVVLLPSLERAPDSLKMLGKLIVGSIKQMMAGCLGNRLEGSVREIVDARPTNAAVPFYVVLDEYGYYAVLGFAVAPAQARSLGFPQPLRSRIRKGDGTWTTMGEILPDDEILLPTGAKSCVREVRLTGMLPVAGIRLANGRKVDAAYSHHWPVRINGQHVVKTTREVEQAIHAGQEVEFAFTSADGLGFERVEEIVFLGVEPTRCIVVEDELHCYVTDDEIVTHNCITFAAQDFSSLQKASKEEADATWENTNVRIIGRITSGNESETWRRVAGVAGDAQVWEAGRKEHQAGTVLDGYRTNLDASVRDVKRVTYDDLAQQENGEFTFLIGKKHSDGTGGVRVIRARTFYTAVKEIPTKIRINHFLKVEPPSVGSGGDQEMETIATLERLIADALKNGDLAKVFPDDPEEMLRQKRPQLYKVRMWVREASGTLPLDQAIRVAFLSDVNESEVRAAEDARRAKAAAEEADAALARTAQLLKLPLPPVANQAAAGTHAPALAAGGEDLPAAIRAAGANEEGVPESTLGDRGSEPASPVRAPIAPEDARAAVIDFLDSFEHDTPALAQGGAGDTAGEGSAMEPGQAISMLTLRPLDDREEPNKLSSYLEEQIASTDAALGIKKDPLEIRADAKRAVDDIEKMTAYWDGPAQSVPTLQEWDAAVEDLVGAVGRKPPSDR